MMKVKPQSKEPVKPLRSGSKVQNMKLPDPPPMKMPKMNPDIEDLSILKKSVDTSVTNPVEILKIFQGGTPEVIETMKNECSMIYECKVCRNLFRSIANFITHKRNYCTTKFSPTQSSAMDSEVLEHSLIVGTEKGTVTTTRKTMRRDILSLLDNFQERMPEVKQALEFTEIPQSSTAVFNTTHSTATIFKDESLSSKHTVVLGPSGHVVGSTEDNGATTQCKSCGESIRDMETHLSMCNSVFKQCFGCPLCEKFFTTTWAVYRHLRKLHGKNTEQVRRLRSLITKQELPVEQKLKRQSIVLPTQNSNNSEKGWLEELQKNGVDGLYMCYICSKQFERRAVLLSHMQACEKRKPFISAAAAAAALSESKKGGSLPSPNHEKQLPTATIQVRVCYKKGVSEKMTDCRVVATRLTEEDTLAALTPLGKDMTQEEDDLHGNKAEDVDDMKLESHVDSDYILDTPSIDKGEIEVNETEDGDIDEIIEDRIEDLMEDEQTSSTENQNIVDVRHNPSQDIFESQQILENHQEVIEVVPPSMSDSDVELAVHPIMTNGFLSSPASSSKAPNSPAANSPEKCNGWALREYEIEKDNFYSTIIESDSNRPHQANESYRGDMTPEEDLDDDCELDSLAITRIICGSVKPEVQESEDEAQDDKYLDNDDTRTVSSEKATPSISTEMSFEFEVEHELEISSDSEFDDINFPINLYISRTDCICLICNTKLADKEALCHIANHLGLNRFTCAIPTCGQRSYFRSDMIEHIQSFHKIDYATSLVKTLKEDEINISDSDKSEFQGFEVQDTALCDVHHNFFDILNNSFGIDSLDDD